jgi:hypothetical protein
MTIKQNRFEKLINYISKIPAIQTPVSNSEAGEEFWWVKFSIEIDHPVAWKVVQEIAHVVNYLSLNERLPAVFYPVSPPPYLNGGPHEFLSWVIESEHVDFSPDLLQQWLEGRLPAPVELVQEWNSDDEDET